MDGVGQAILDRLADGPVSYTQLTELGINPATIARKLYELVANNQIRRNAAQWELIPMANVCVSCGTELTDANWYPSFQKPGKIHRKCKTCAAGGKSRSKPKPAAASATSPIPTPPG